MVLRIRQGLDSDRESFTPASGELIYTTDQKEVWVGDGTTAGGIAVSGGGGGGGATTLGALNDVVISDPTVGEVLKYDGTNWVNDTDASGGGGLTTEEVEDIVAAMFADGSQTNITITYNDNGTGNGTFDVTANAGGGGSGNVGAGIAGRLAYYATTGTTVTDVGSGVNWDNDTNTLTLNNLVFNGSSISTDDSGAIELANVVHMLSDIQVDGDIFIAPGYHVYADGFHNDDNIAIVPTGGEGVVAIGGFLNGEDYGAKLEVRAWETQVGFNPIYGGNSMASFINIFGNPGDPSVQPPSVALCRARGTPTAQLPVENYDSAGILSFNLWDGDNFVLSAGFGHILTGAPSSNVMPGGLGCFVANSSGVSTQIWFVDGQNERFDVQRNLVMSEINPITFVNDPSKTLSITTPRVKFTPLTSVERDALTGVVVGEVIFNTTSTKLQVCSAIGPVVWDDLN
jgi:hypothetical protein